MLLGEEKTGYQQIIAPFSLSCHINVIGNYSLGREGESGERNPEASRRGTKQSSKHSRKETNKIFFSPCQRSGFWKPLRIRQRLWHPGFMAASCKAVSAICSHCECEEMYNVI